MIAGRTLDETDKRTKKMRKLLLASAGLLAWGGIASAQTPDALINVNIQDVLQDIAVDLNVSENSIPVNVQLPINLAANVCDVDVSVLSAKVETGDATCVAVTGSQEVTQIVSQQIDASADDDATASDDTGDDATDDTTTSSTNSAKQFAPGQQDKAANKVAPGQTDDPKAAAPGQMKKACAEGDESCASD
jgi:hypothetical protein